MSAFGVILVRIFPAFSCIRTECGELRSMSFYSVRMPENMGKMPARITSNADTFYAMLESQKMWQNIEHMFEAVKRKSNRNYNSQEILLDKNNTRKTWNILKEVINKTNKSGPHLANKIVINKNDLTNDI